LNTTVNQNNALQKLEKDLNVDAMAVDKNKFYNNPDKQKGERYLAWLKSIKTDKELDESVKLIGDMIHPDLQVSIKK